MGCIHDYRSKLNSTAVLFKLSNLVFDRIKVKGLNVRFLEFQLDLPGSAATTKEE